MSGNDLLRQMYTKQIIFELRLTFPSNKIIQAIKDKEGKWSYRTSFLEEGKKVINWNEFEIKLDEFIKNDIVSQSEN